MELIDIAGGVQDVLDHHSLPVLLFGNSTTGSRQIGDKDFRGFGDEEEGLLRYEAHLVILGANLPDTRDWQLDKLTSAVPQLILVLLIVQMIPVFSIIFLELLKIEVVLVFLCLAKASKSHFFIFGEPFPSLASLF